MAYEGYYYWKNWADYLQAEDERGIARLNEIGCLVLKPKRYDWGRSLEYHEDLGIPYEIWDHQKLNERMPHFVLDSFWPPKRPESPDFEVEPEDTIAEAVLFPLSGYINDPQLSVHNLQRAAEAKGARFLFNSEVIEIRRTEKTVTGITLKDGAEFDAPVVVNAAGPHSFVVNRMAGIDEGMKIKTKALRHEVHFVPSPEEFSYEEKGVLVSDGDIGGYHRPETGDMILVGSEDPECDPQEWIADPDDFNREVTGDQWKAQVYRLARRIPTLPIPSKPTGLVDLYDVTDDWIPIYDKSDLKGFYLAIGTSGNQYKNGPVVGHLMTELIDACELGHDHDRDPIQVKCRYIDYVLNTGFYSRLRDINPDSSYSVLG
jgi:sarcosine oxidase subunit beta